MRALDLRPVVAFALLVVACSGDDGSADDDTSGATAMPTTGTTSAPTSTGTPMDTTAAMDDSTTSPGSTGEPPATDSGTGPVDDSGTDSGGMLDGVVLQNDAWTPTESIVFQTWPNTGDCWAATFEPDAAHYPFEIVGAIAAIGNAKGTYAFGVGVWTVDNMGMPDTEIDSTSVDIDGATMDLTEIDFGALGLNIPTVDSGDFAIVMCHDEHMGEPSIAIDADGTVSGPNNWVFQQAMGEWVQSPDFFGTDGDFILRAVIQPQG